MSQSEIKQIVSHHAAFGKPYDCSVEEQLHPFGDRLAPALIDCVQNGSEQERLFALVALRHAEKKAVEMVPVLIELLKGDRLTAMTASETLGYFESLAVEAVSFLEQHLNSTDELRRVVCAGATLRIQPRHQQAFSVLLTALDENGAQQNNAVFYLGILGEVAVPVLPKLKQLLYSKDESLRIVAEEAIDKIKIGSADKLD